MLASCRAFCAQQLTNTEEPLTVGDVHISYLPLAHIYERVVFTANLRYVRCPPSNKHQGHQATTS